MPPVPPLVMARVFVTAADCARSIAPNAGAPPPDGILNTSNAFPAVVVTADVPLPITTPF